MPSIENINIPIKTVIVIVFWVVSMAGLYFTMQSEVAELKKESAELRNTLDKYDVKVLDYKVTNLELQLKQLNDKADRIQNLLSR